MEMKVFNPQEAVQPGRYVKAEHWESGQSYAPSISTNKGRFTFMVDGAQVGTHQFEFQGVIVGQFPEGKKTYRIYYEGAYDENETKAPSCWSLDGKTPHADVTAPRNASCEGCPMNAVGSGIQKDTRACRFAKNIAVMIPSIPDKVFQMRLSAQAIFAKTDPATNYAGLFAYDAMLGNMIPQEVITQFGQPEGQTGGVRMKPTHILPANVADRMVESSKSQIVRDTVVPMISGGTTTTPALGHTPAPAPAPAALPPAPSNFDNLGAVGTLADTHVQHQRTSSLDDVPAPTVRNTAPAPAPEASQYENTFAAAFGTNMSTLSETAPAPTPAKVVPTKSSRLATAFS